MGGGLCTHECRCHEVHWNQTTWVGVKGTCKWSDVSSENQSKLSPLEDQFLLIHLSSHSLANFSLILVRTLKHIGMLFFYPKACNNISWIIKNSWFLAAHWAASEVSIQLILVSPSFFFPTLLGELTALAQIHEVILATGEGMILNICTPEET